MASPPKLLGDKAPVGVQKYPPPKFALQSGDQRKDAGIFPAFLGEFGAEIMQWLKSPKLRSQDMERRRKGLATSQALTELDERLQRLEADLDGGKYIPCTLEGCENFTKNALDLDDDYGFCCSKHRALWHAEQRQALAELELAAWDEVELGKLDADWVMQAGVLVTEVDDEGAGGGGGGGGVPFSPDGCGPDWYAWRDHLLQAQADVSIAVEAAWQPIVSKMLADTDGKGIPVPSVSHPQATIQPVMHINDTYYFAWKILGRLYRAALMMALKGGGHGVAWSIKSALRLRNKARDKYGGDVSKVKDVARCSVCFETVADLRKGILYLTRNMRAAKLCDVCSIKNRLYAPNKIGGYRYVVLYVKIDKYVGEIMVHLTETNKALCRASELAYHWLQHLDAAYEGEGYFGAHSPSGLYDGLGRYCYATQRMYAGEWREGLRHGRGVMARSDGWRYEGEWAEGKQKGVAHIVYKNGDEYFGQVVNGHRHGKGLLLLQATGQAWVGDFIKDVRDGYCLLTSEALSRRKLRRLLDKTETKRPEKITELVEEEPPLAFHCLFEEDKMITDHGLDEEDCKYNREAWRAFDRARVVARDAVEKAALCPRPERAIAPQTDTAPVSPRGCFRK